jgi:hypothetical protein
LKGAGVRPPVDAQSAGHPDPQVKP